MQALLSGQLLFAALVFACNHAHDDYAGEMTVDETAAVIAVAAGAIGTNRDYLEQMARQLEALEIEDPYVTQLLCRVRDLCGVV